MGSTAEMNIVHKLQQQMNNLGCVIHASGLLMSRERNNEFIDSQASRIIPCAHAR